LPIPLNVCPACSAGVKQTRGWTWIDPRPWLQGACFGSRDCPVADPAALGDRVGLLWIGEKFYPTPEHFIHEADRLGISKRIAAVPRGLELGKTWVFLAHPKTVRAEEEWIPGIFRIFRPTAVEKLVTQTQAEHAEEMEKLARQGITPVVVPDHDPDHQGSVYDDEPATPPFEATDRAGNIFEFPQ